MITCSTHRTFEGLGLISVDEKDTEDGSIFVDGYFCSTVIFGIGPVKGGFTLRNWVVV